MTLTGEYAEYTTLQNDTWDFIAWQQYGDAMLLNVIVEANPHVAITPVLPMGVVLAIPILGEIRPSISNNQRPPWRAK